MQDDLEVGHRSEICLLVEMDGVAGVEPANDRIKICWLTTCRHPIKSVTRTIGFR